LALIPQSGEAGRAGPAGGKRGWGAGRGRNLPRPGQKPSVATAEISWQVALMDIGLPLPRGLGSF